MKKFKDIKKIKQSDKPCPYCKPFGFTKNECKGYKCWER